MNRDDIKPNSDEFDERSAEEILKEIMSAGEEYINNKGKDIKNVL